MHLNEFADPKTYALSANNMAAILKQFERILERWTTRISAVREEQPNGHGQRNLTDACATQWD